MANDPLLRREKKTPAQDFWHTLRIGVVLFIILLPVLHLMLD